MKSRKKDLQLKEHFTFGLGVPAGAKTIAKPDKTMFFNARCLRYADGLTDGQTSVLVNISPPVQWRGGRKHFPWQLLSSLNEHD